VTNELLTTTEVADLLKVSKRSIYEMCKEQDLKVPFPVIRLNKKHVRFSRVAVERWIEQMQETR
jgi:excisionase family DNA binding protein